MNPPDTPSLLSASNRWKAVLLLVAVFVLGAGLGIGGTLYFVRSQVRSAMLHPLAERGRIDRLSARVESHLTRSLNLDAGEQQAVREELATSLKRARRIRLRALIEVRLLIRDTVSRIENRLPVEKRAKFKRQAEERLSRWGFRLDGPETLAEPKE